MEADIHQAFAIAQQVEVVGIHHDALEFGAAAAALAAALAGLIALWLARRSATAASTSAASAQRSLAAAELSLAAAGESLAIQRAEANVLAQDRARRATPAVTLSGEALFDREEDGEGRTVVLQLGFRNEGDRAAELVYVNFLVPGSIGARMKPCNQYSQPTGDGTSILWSEESIEDGSASSCYWDGRIDHLSPRGAVSKLQHLLLEYVPPGVYHAKAVLMHQDLEPKGVRSRFWTFEVPSVGNEIFVQYLGDVDDG